MRKHHVKNKNRTVFRSLYKLFEIENIYLRLTIYFKGLTFTLRLDDLNWRQYITLTKIYQQWNSCIAEASKIRFILASKLVASSQDRPKCSLNLSGPSEFFPSSHMANPPKAWMQDKIFDFQHFFFIFFLIIILFVCIFKKSYL